MKKVLIIGIKGMAGHVMMRYLSSLEDYSVFGIARDIVVKENIFSLDVTETTKLKRIINDNSFDIIINCIGILNKDAEDNPSKAIWINSYFPHLLEDLTKNSKTKLIQISTDCVFSGKKGNYLENDLKDGIGFYARTKGLGEVINKKDLTIRVSIIGPELNNNGIGLFHWFMNQKEEVINGFSEAYWSGITTIELANAVDAMIKSEVTGLFHLTMNNKISKFNLLNLLNEIFRNGRVFILKNGDYSVDKSLLNSRNDFVYNLPSYEEMLKSMKKWIKDNHSLYSQNYTL